jgi:uncharacterized protein
MLPTSMHEADATMRAGWSVGLAFAFAALLQAPAPGTAASFDCSVRGLSLSEVAICRDPQLSRADEQMARRLDGFARRLNYGQYLGLRFWQSSQARYRQRCGADVACLNTGYRMQMRLLDRLQQCLDTSAQRRACLRSTLSAGRDGLKQQQGDASGQMRATLASSLCQASPRHTPS